MDQESRVIFSSYQWSKINTEEHARSFLRASVHLEENVKCVMNVM